MGRFLEDTCWGRMGVEEENGVKGRVDRGDRLFQQVSFGGLR